MALTLLATDKISFLLSLKLTLERKKFCNEKETLNLARVEKKTLMSNKAEKKALTASSNDPFIDNLLIFL